MTYHDKIDAVDRIKQFKAKHNLSVTELQRIFGLKRNRIGNWMRGTSLPDSDVIPGILENMAAYENPKTGVQQKLPLDETPNVPISRRDYFAGQAINAIMSDGDIIIEPYKRAVEIADAMIAELDKIETKSSYAGSAGGVISPIKGNGATYTTVVTNDSSRFL